MSYSKVSEMGVSLYTRRRIGECEAEVEWHGATVLVRMRGALDFYSAHEARRLLLDQLERQPSRVVIDASDAFVDSSGIGVLVHVAQRVKIERGDFRLVCHERLAELLSRHRLDALLGIETPDQDLQRTPSKGQPATAAAPRHLKTAA